MRVLVCGGRNYTNRLALWNYLDRIHGSNWMITLIIQGEARGADTLARQWAEARGVPVAPYPADWSEGLRAGSRRNQRMLDEGKPQLVVAAPGGSGTRDMVRRAQEAGLRVLRIPPV